MKRGGPLRRRVGLKSSSRATLKRTSSPNLKASSTLKRTSSLSRGKPRSKVKVPKATREAVKARSGGRCVMCEWLFERGELAIYRPRRIAHLHHVLEERNYPELALEAANLIGLCVPCHFDHENFAGHGSRRIPLAALPREALELADARGLRGALERLYASP